MGLNFGNIAKAFGNKKNGTTTTTGTTSTTGTTAKAPTTVSGTVVTAAPKVGVSPPPSQSSTKQSSPYSYMSTTGFKAPPSTAPSTTMQNQPSLVTGARLNVGSYKKPPTTTPTWSRADLNQSSAPPKAPVEVSGTVSSPGVTSVSGTVVNSNNTNKSSGVPPQYTGGTIGNTPLIAGALNYATADKAGRQQIVNNQARIKNDPAYAQSEIGRTLQVIQDRQSRGEDTSAQEKYLYVNLGYRDSMDANTNQNNENNLNYSRTPEELAAEIDAKLKAEEAERIRLAEQEKAAIQANYNYLNGLTQDGRVLENLQFDRVNAPTNWDGSTGYRGAMLDRNRSIQDTQSQLQFQSALNAIDQGLSDYQSQLAGRRETMLADAYRNERDYYLNETSMFGSDSQGRQTLQSRESDRNFGLNEASMYGTSSDGRQTAAFRNQIFNEGMSINEMTGNFIDPRAMNVIDQIISLKRQAESKGITAQQRATLSQQSDVLRAQLPASVDPSLFGSNVSAAQAMKHYQSLGRPTQSAYEFGQNMGFQRDQFNRGIYESDRAYNFDVDQADIANSQQNMRDAISLAESLGYVTPYLSALTGIPEGTPTAQASQFLQTLKQRETEFEWDQNTMIADAEASRLAAEAEAAAANSKSIQDFAKSYVNSIAQRDNKTKKVVNKEEVFAAFLASGYSDEEIDQILPQYGITQSDIESFGLGK